MTTLSASDEKIQVIVRCRARSYGIGTFRFEFLMTLQKDKRLSLDYEKYASRLLKSISPKLEFFEMIDVVDFENYFKLEAENNQKIHGSN